MCHNGIYCHAYLCRIARNSVKMALNQGGVNCAEEVYSQAFSVQRCPGMRYA